MLFLLFYVYLNLESRTMSVDEPFPVTVHPYRSRTRGSCAYELGGGSHQNAIIFIGGLKDGPHTTPYIRVVAKHLETRPDLDYSIFEIRMRSSFLGFGTSCLTNDVQDISSLVSYLRKLGKQKIVLFGHSTGTQVNPHRYTAGFVCADD